MATKKLKFGIDYDGIVADTSAMKAKYIRDHRGQIVAPWQTDRATCEEIIGKDNYKMLSEHVYSRPFTLGAPEVPGAIYSLYQIDQVGEIYLVTARPPNRLNFAREWLEKFKAIEYFKDLVSIKDDKGHEVSKGQLCQRLGLDILIDDELRYLTEPECRDLNRRILLKNGCTDKMRVPRGIEFARNWKEALDLLGIHD